MLRMSTKNTRETLLLKIPIQIGIEVISGKGFYLYID